MNDPQMVATPRVSTATPLIAVGSLLAARDLSELALAAALIPAQLLGARETLVLITSPSGDILERQPNRAGSALEHWARGEFGRARPDEPSREGSRLAVGLEAVDGWSGVIAVDMGIPGGANANGNGDGNGNSSASAPDDEATRGLIELGRILSRCVGQIASLKRRAAALEDTRRSIGKGLHDLRTPLNSLRLGLHLLEPGLIGQDPQVVQRTHRAVDRLAALVTEMYESLQEKTAAR